MIRFVKPWSGSASDASSRSVMKDSRPTGWRASEPDACNSSWLAYDFQTESRGGTDDWKIEVRRLFDPVELPGYCTRLGWVSRGKR